MVLIPSLYSHDRHIFMYSVCAHIYRKIVSKENSLFLSLLFFGFLSLSRAHVHSGVGWWIGCDSSSLGFAVVYI